MRYYSTNGEIEPVSFQEALFKGLPADNGLFMPELVPQLSEDFFSSLGKTSLPEMAFEVLAPYISDEIPSSKLSEIVEDTLNFEIPIKEVEKDVFTLELFHGPTLAFKDVGARFMARCFAHFLSLEQKRITILVATSGDTGSAVANGFYNVNGIDVVVLYPKGMVSEIQEKQMTTLGENITCLEVSGTFDDCQRMVKQAFLDGDLNERLNLSSANSINIARLLPQSVYYFWAFAQLGQVDQDVIVSVPSGNYGNLTAGLLAKKMGLPINHFVAASNANDIVPKYLHTGTFEPKPSLSTISNAMDVGNPSNFARMSALYQKPVALMKDDISGYSYQDDDTKDTLKQVNEKSGYLLDPHGAVGYLGLKEHIKYNKGIGIFLETAHPSKFKGVVEDATGQAITLPETLESAIKKDKRSIPIAGAFEEFKDFLFQKESA